MKIEREFESLKVIVNGYCLFVYYKLRELWEKDVIKCYESFGKFEFNKRVFEFVRELSVSNYEEFLFLKGFGLSILRVFLLFLSLFMMFI